MAPQLKGITPVASLWCFSKHVVSYHTASAGPLFLAPTDPSPPLSVYSTFSPSFSSGVTSSWKFEPFIPGSPGWKGKPPYFDILQGLGITRKNQNKTDCFLQMNLFMLARGPWSCHRMPLGTRIHALLSLGDFVSAMLLQGISSTFSSCFSAWSCRCLS